jgi:short-chain fatty acids transporter
LNLIVEPEAFEMVRALGNTFSKVARRWLPDAFIFAVILTFAVLFLGMAVQKKSFIEMTGYWGNDFWTLLTFAMQMAMILITGSALATSRPVHRAIVGIARMADTPTKAIFTATAAMIIGCWFNWGFGLIVSAIVAKEMARRIRGIHYPLLVASAYSGFVVWHAGWSGSIPLKVASQDDIMTRFADGAVIPISETIMSWPNLLLIAVFLITIPLLNVLMAPKGKDPIIEVDPDIFDDNAEAPLLPKDQMTPAQRIENSVAISMVIGALGLLSMVLYYSAGGGTNLDSMNFLFLFLGILLHKTPIRYVRSINEAIRTCGGIALQFPFYAGIMGMMIKSGLAGTISQVFVDISNPTTLPVFTYLSAGLVNLFVPSGGGQWVVQGPVVMPAAKALGVSYSKAAMAIAWGDAWTNMIQPFWALPLLAVAKLSIRDIMGYTTVILIYTGIVTSLFLMIF